MFVNTTRKHPTDAERKGDPFPPRGDVGPQTAECSKAKTKSNVPKPKTEKMSKKPGRSLSKNGTQTEHEYESKSSGQRCNCAPVTDTQVH